MGIYLWLALERSNATRPRRPRTLVALGAVALALLLPAVALASHTFADVPTTHTFHTNISNLAGAGVTAGCGGGNYCPEQPVTRGQMAGFLNRGLGRVAEADLSKIISGTTNTEVGSLTITPGTSAGALAGARQFVHAQFNGTISFIDITGCPCVVHVFLLQGDFGVHGYIVSLTVSTAGAYFPISAGGVIAVTGSAPVTISVRAYIQPGGGSATAYSVTGNLVAETIPFGSTGTSAP